MPLIRMKDGDIVNPCHIVKYANIRNGQVKMLLSTGETQYGETDDDIDEAFFPIVPASSGFVAVFARIWDDRVFQYRRRTVIAWRICPAGNWPLFEGSDSTDDCHDVMIDPDGGVFDGDGNNYPSFDVWKAEFEREANLAMAAA